MTMMIILAAYPNSKNIFDAVKFDESIKIILLTATKMRILF